MNLTTTTTAVVRIQEEHATALQSRGRGQVIPPESALFDEARQAFNRLVDQRPALILIAANAQDVAEGVQFARGQGLGVAIQSTGHGVILPADNAVMIITSQLRDILVDASSGTAHLGAGLKWGEVLAETQKFGLAPLLGSSPGVGVVGYTLGGGLGWLGRKHGLACDSVLSFELVSADGQVLTASATENADLFWGLRGGGGGFGIVTSMVIQLHPVDTVYGGNLFYPGEMAREVMQRYREWIRAAPDALNFGEGDTAPKTGADALRALLDTAAPLVQFGEVGGDKDKPDPVLNGEELGNEARAFMESQAAKGITIDAATAVRHVQKKGA